MKCHICKKKVDKKENYKTHIFRKMFSNKRVVMHWACWEGHLKKF